MQLQSNQSEQVQRRVASSTKSYEDMNKKELLKVAAELNIKGRHDMSKEDLLEAIQEEPEGAEDLDFDLPTAEQAKEIKRRRKSSAQRDDTGKVIRKSKNLSGNVPYQPKIYALREELHDPKTWSKTYQESVKVLPMQMQLVLKFLAETGFEGQGKDIISEAIAKGYLKTKIEPANLFAYYAKKFQNFGVYCITDEE